MDNKYGNRKVGYTIETYVDGSAVLKERFETRYGPFGIFKITDHVPYGAYKSEKDARDALDRLVKFNSGFEVDASMSFNLHGKRDDISW